MLYGATIFLWNFSAFYLCVALILSIRINLIVQKHEVFYLNAICVWCCAHVNRNEIFYTYDFQRNTNVVIILVFCFAKHFEMYCIESFQWLMHLGNWFELSTHTHTCTIEFQKNFCLLREFDEWKTSEKNSLHFIHSFHLPNVTQ